MVRKIKMEYTPKGRIKQTQIIDGKIYRFWGRERSLFEAKQTKLTEENFVYNSNKPFGNFFIIEENKRSQKPFIILAEYDLRFANPKYEMHTPIPTKKQKR